MRPLLASSIALLLLALCKPSSSTVQSTNTQTSTSTIKIGKTKQQQDEAAKKFAAGADEAKLKKLEELLGNTILALELHDGDAYDGLPAYYKDALNNGVLCEVQGVTTLETEIKKVLYGGDGTAALTPAQHDVEKKAAKDLKKMAIDCTVTTPDGCLCTEKRPLLYCLAQTLVTKMGATPKKTCMKEAIKALEDAGKKTIVKEIVSPTPSEPNAEPTLAAMTKSEAPEMASFFCEFIDTAKDAQPLIQAVYAADARPWTHDSILFGDMNFGPDDSLDKLCDAPGATLPNIPLGKCLCDKKSGFSFCMSRAVGKVFKDMGYLDCAATPPAFKNAAGSGEVLKAAIASAFGTPPGPPAPNPNTQNATTTKGPGGSAATSSLLLVPAAAAAAMLLRQ